MSQSLTPADKALMDGKWKQAAQLIFKEQEAPVYKDVVKNLIFLTTLSRLSGNSSSKIDTNGCKEVSQSRSCTA